MKLSQLVDDLSKLYLEHGDVDVRLQCDHGQELLKVICTGITYIPGDSYMPETRERSTKAYPIKVVEIQAF